MTARSRRLVVVLYGRLAGTIQRDGGTLSFSYDDDYLTSPQATPLSLSMPLSTTTYTNKWAEARLRGLLPDNDEVRRRWAAHFGLRDRDTFGLIAAIGTDVSGAAVFVPEEDYPGVLGTGHVEPIDEAGIAARLRSLRADSADWLGDDEHWSLAGAQSKFTLRAMGDGWGIAHGAEASSHIAKPGIGMIPGQALIEHVSMLAARSVGLEVARTSYQVFEDQPVVLIERFDRVERAGRLVRVHQEDLCQAFALDPIRKYEADGGPGAQRIADLLGAVTTDDSVRRFAKAIIVNHLLGAPDAHAKNYAVLLAGPAVRLAPLYDIASGLTADRDGTLRYPKGAMSIGGERAFGEVRGSHWDRFAGRIGLSADQVRAWVKELSDAVPDALSDALKSEGRPARAPEISAVLPRVRLLAELTLAGLEAGGAGRRS